MKKAIFLVCVLSLLLATQVMASGSSGGYSGGGSASSGSMTVTQTHKCIITYIRADGTVMVQDKPGAPEHPLRFSKKTKLSAQDKKQFDGRKKLDVADLKVGQELKVTHRPASGEVLKIKVLKAS